MRCVRNAAHSAGALALLILFSHPLIEERQAPIVAVVAGLDPTSQEWQTRRLNESVRAGEAVYEVAERLNVRGSVCCSTYPPLNRESFFHTSLH
jgi:hypothetical protein